MTRNTLCALLLGMAFLSFACQKNASTPATSASPSAAALSEDEKAIAALGAAMGKQMADNVKALNLRPAELELLKKGIGASLDGQAPQYAIEQYGSRLQVRAQEQAAVLAEAEKKKSEPFLAKVAQEPGVVKTPSGLLFKTVSPGKGATPKATDVVRVNYRGTLVDGTEFDASAKHGGPATFQLNGVIRCWTEGVGRMKVGEKARLVCPSDIAYGNGGQGPIPPGATLVFDVELVGIGAPKAAGGPAAR